MTYACLALGVAGLGCWTDLVLLARLLPAALAPATKRGARSDQRRKKESPRLCTGTVRVLALFFFFFVFTLTSKSCVYLLCTFWGS